MDDLRDGPAGFALDGPLSFPFFPPALADPLLGGVGGPAAAPARVARPPRSYLERVPRVEQGGPRDVRAGEKLADLVNGLLRTGALVRLPGVNEWDVRPRRHVSTRPPAVTDDSTLPAYPGDLWIDQSGRAVYACVSNNAGSAEWKQITP